MNKKWPGDSQKSAVPTRRRRARTVCTGSWPLTPGPSRRGVTLIELLITMAIMAILSAAILGTATAAMESARRSRTQQLITKISELIVERMASYEGRRVPISPVIVGAIDTRVNSTSDPNTRAIYQTERGQILADARLLGVRELIKMEMPDTVEDIQHIPLVLAERPSASVDYFRRYIGNNPDRATEHDSAECLYMTVMSVTGEGEARTLFAKQDIGDTDDDGAPEFVDGWGQPIRWLRWAPGFVSDLQPMEANGARPGLDPLDPWGRDRQPVGSTSLTPPDAAYPQVKATNDSPATFQQTYLANIRQRLLSNNGPVHKSAFRIAPLVYSVGPDGASAYLIPKDPTVKPLDPFQIMADVDFNQVGAPDASLQTANKDNITNHLIEY